jgi:hypothetical protein
MTNPPNARLRPIGSSFTHSSGTKFKNSAIAKPR